MKTKSAPIIWAVDPFVEDPNLQRSALLAIDRLGLSEGARVVPTYVTNILDGISKRSSGKETLELVREEAEARLKSVTASATTPREPLRIIAEKFSSTAESANILVQFAKKMGAEMIILSTHARKGPLRWVLGSFAETLSLVSNVPLLIARPGWKPKASEKSVLFVTDFSVDSRAAYLTLLKTAAKRKWSITVFHYVEFPLIPGYEGITMLWDAYEKEFKDEIRLAMKVGNEWAEQGRKFGVTTEARVIGRRKGDFPTAVLSLLKKDFLLLAFSAQSVDVPWTLLGASSRKLLRNSPVPVWIIRSLATKKKESQRKRDKSEVSIADSLPVIHEKSAILI